MDAIATTPLKPNILVWGEGMETNPSVPLAGLATPSRRGSVASLSTTAANGDPIDGLDWPSDPKAAAPGRVCCCIASQRCGGIPLCCQVVGSPATPPLLCQLDPLSGHPIATNPSGRVCGCSGQRHGDLHTLNDSGYGRSSGYIWGKPRPIWALASPFI